MEHVQEVAVPQKKSKRYWLKMIKYIHDRKIREQYVNDGTEEPPERNDITKIFQEKQCYSCGRQLKSAKMKYCEYCK